VGCTCSATKILTGELDWPCGSSINAIEKDHTEVMCMFDMIQWLHVVNTEFKFWIFTSRVTGDGKPCILVVGILRSVCWTCAPFPKTALLTGI
jgi:hypothetical protein